MKSPLWFVLAGVIAVASFVAAGFYVMSRIGETESSLTQVVMPGSAELNLKEARTYTIFHETRTVVDGRSYASSSADGLRLTLTSPGGGAVDIRPAAMNSTYSFGPRQGRAIHSFTVTTPGIYRLTGTLASGRSEPKIVLAIEHGTLGKMFGMIGMAIGIVFGGLAIAAVIVFVVLWQRHMAKRRV